MTTDIGPPQMILRDLGYLILKSQMIEHLLAVILATTRAEKDITPIEVARSLADCRSKTLEQLINELSQSQNSAFQGQFIELLKAFCKNRNMLVHNLILTKDFDAKFANDPDALKGFIPLFDDIVNDLTAIQDTTIRDKFTESIVTGELRDSNSDTGKPLSFEALNSILRHFMSEKWAQKAIKANKPAHPTAGNVHL